MNNKWIHLYIVGLKDYRQQLSVLKYCFLSTRETNVFSTSSSRKLSTAFSCCNFFKELSWSRKLFFNSSYFKEKNLLKFLIIAIIKKGNFYLLLRISYFKRWVNLFQFDFNFLFRKVKEHWLHCFNVSRNILPVFYFKIVAKKIVNEFLRNKSENERFNQFFSIICQNFH